MKIALIGTRGVPASYSGFETCAEQLGQRLVSRGHEVTVYCRTPHIQYPGSTYKGMRLVKLPTIRNKYLDTIVHTLISSLHALGQGYDVALYFIVGNSPVTWIPRLVGTRTLLNVDGLDWKRSKWPPLAKGYIRLSERLATVLPDGFITDSLVVQDYYRERFNRVPPSIPYGSDVEIIPPGETLERFGLRSREYVLFVGRLVPENCAHDLVSAYRHLETQMKCVIVGDAPYAESYKENLKAIAAQDPRVLLTGYVFGRGYHELGSNAYLFVEPSGVGGTHPALVEAMAFGNCVVVNGTPENRETIGDAGLAYDSETGPDGLHEVLARLIRDQRAVEEFQEKARERARTFYSWDKITQDYEQLFLRAIGRVDIDEGLGRRSREG